MKTSDCHFNRDMRYHTLLTHGDPPPNKTYFPSSQMPNLAKKSYLTSSRRSSAKKVHSWPQVKKTYFVKKSVCLGKTLHKYRYSTLFVFFVKTHLGLLRNTGKTRYIKIFLKNVNNFLIVNLNFAKGITLIPLKLRFVCQGKLRRIRQKNVIYII